MAFSTICFGYKEIFLNYLCPFPRDNGPNIFFIIDAASCRRLGLKYHFIFNITDVPTRGQWVKLLMSLPETWAKVSFSILWNQRLKEVSLRILYGAKQATHLWY